MELKLDSDGNPTSALFAALSGKHINLTDKKGEAHLLQVIAPKAREVGSSMQRLLDKLEALPNFWDDVKDFDYEAVGDSYRRLIYDVTELLDAYAQMLPAILKQNKDARSALKTFEPIAKRLRDPWSLMCNRFKHKGAQISHSRFRHRSTLLVSHGYMFLKPAQGDSMLLDTDVHKPPERRATYARRLHELMHAIFRLDLNAAKLVNSIPDQPNQAPKDYNFNFPFAGALQRLDKMRVVVAERESTSFDGVALVGDTVQLVRMHAAKVPDPCEAMTQFKGDGFTSTFAFK